MKTLKSTLVTLLCYLLFVFVACSDAHDHEADLAGSSDAGNVLAEDTHEADDPDHDHEAETAETAATELLHDENDPTDTHEEDEAAPADEEGGVALDAKTMELIGLKTATAELRDFDEVINATGKVINNENQEVHVNSLVSGRITSLMSNWGDNVGKGQPLICIESTELGMKRAEFSKARAEFELAEVEYNRNKKLFDKNAVSERQLLESETSKKSAKINLEYTRNMLLLSGLSNEEIDNPVHDEHSAIEGCSVHLVSPMKGMVIERNVRIGEQIAPGTCVYKILDLSSVWIEVDVFEKDIRYATIGRKIHLSVPAYPERIFTGIITSVGGIIDEGTRTVKIRSEVKNSDYALKPGMFAAVEIVVEEKRNVLAIPEQAVMTEENVSFVFVKEGDEFHRHNVVPGNRGSGMVEILSGISRGYEIVIQGNYQLKSRLAMSTADPHAGHVH